MTLVPSPPRRRLAVVPLLLCACPSDPPAPGEANHGSTGVVESSTMTMTTTRDAESMGAGPGDQTSTTTAGSTTTSGSATGTTGAPPVALLARADRYATPVDVALELAAADGVLANDEGESLTALGLPEATSLLTELGGIVELGADGSLIYDPPDGFWGDDRFAYRVRDAFGEEAMAEVRVVVQPQTEEAAALARGIGGFVIDGPGPGLRAGYDTAAAGDVNGDGYDDVVVMTGSSVSGAFVVFGRPGAEALTLEALGEDGFAITGDAVFNAVGGGVDVNGDGLDDVIVGSAGSGTGGRALVVYGKADADPVTLAALQEGEGGFVIEGQGGSFGWSVAGAGDIDGDGLDAVVVGAPFESGLAEEEGRTYVVFGRPEGGLVEVSNLGGAGFAIVGAGEGHQSGEVVAGAGDANGDGYADLLIGAPFAADPMGVVYVVFGGPAVGLFSLPLALFDGETEPAPGFAITGVTGERIGRSLAFAGDVDGDGLDDVVIGPESRGEAVRAYVVSGRAQGAPVSLTGFASGLAEGFAITGTLADAFPPAWVAGGGDVDGDGLDDLVIGASRELNRAGRVFVVSGRTSRAPLPLAQVEQGEAGFVLEGDASTEAGYRADMAGDVNGDGLTDVIFGAPSTGFGDLPSYGRAFVAFGGDFSSPVAQRGTAAAETLTGTSEGESMVAGDGDDRLEGGGGPDVLYGGRGDDVVVVPDDAFFRVRGGHGLDTLALVERATIDLDDLPLQALRGLEVIDLGAPGVQTLRASYDALRPVIGGRTLTVVGTEDDQVSLDLRGHGFTAVTEDDDEVATNGAITVRVDRRVASGLRL